MTQHDSLRERFEQHAIKNNYSKIDDEKIKEAIDDVILILTEAYPNHKFSHKANLMFKDIEKYCGRAFNIDFDYSMRKIIPDGGVIWMDNKYPIVLAEMKRQGTNDERMNEGKKKQATGNAIERLGKNLTGIKVLFENDTILPFICFCWGCDFKEGTVLAKLYTLNSFYELNHFYTGEENRYNKPITILTKPESPFTREELVWSLLQIAEKSIHYFEEKEGK